MASSDAPAQPTSKAAGGFITVTVTASPATVTVTVTEGASATSSTTVKTKQPTTALSTSTTTVSPLPVSTSSEISFAPESASAASAVATSLPEVEPFLNPESSVVQASTMSPPISQVAAPPTTTKIPTSTLILPTPSETPFKNATAHAHRPHGRTVRLRGHSFHL